MFKTKMFCIMLLLSIVFAGKVGIKPSNSPHLGAICHDNEDLVHPLVEKEIKENQEKVVLKTGQVMLRKKFEEISNPKYSLYLKTSLISESGNGPNIETVILLTKNSIKVTEWTNLKVNGDMVRNERVIKFGSGSAPFNLVAIACKINDKNVRHNALARFKELYPDVDTNC